MISIVIPTHTSHLAHLRPLLDSLARQTCREFETLVVVNEDLGYESAANLGARKAKGKWLFILNADLTLSDCCLERLLEHALATGCDCTSATILQENGHFGAGALDVFGYPLKRVSDSTRAHHFVYEGCPFIRREAFERVGGFDGDVMRMYADEFDLSWRLWLSGCNIARPCAEALLHHHYPGPAVKDHVRLYANRNVLITIAKNSQHVLLGLLLPAIVFTLAQFPVMLWLTRSLPRAWNTTGAAAIQAVGAWRHILRGRRLNARNRRRGDVWIAWHFLRIGFGRRQEIASLLYKLRHKREVAHA